MLLNKPIPLKYLFHKAKGDVMYMSLLAIVVHVVTSFFQHIFPPMPLTIPTFIGTAISILLSFKLNQSYDRWWEARKVWGSIVNDSRSFVLQLQGLIAGDNREVIKKMAYRQIAWCYALSRSLRGLGATENLDKYLTEGDLESLKSHNNIPLALLALHAVDLKELKAANKLDSFSHVQMDSTVVRLCDAQGKSERIKGTVFPVTYRLFLRFMIYLFVVTLSISLQNVSWYFEIPLLLLISSSFFFLEKSAILMQDPFENRPTDTPTTAIARTIEINIKQLLNETDIPHPHQPENFYLL